MCPIKSTAVLLDIYFNKHISFQKNVEYITLTREKAKKQKARGFGFALATETDHPGIYISKVSLNVMSYGRIREETFQKVSYFDGYYGFILGSG